MKLILLFASQPLDGQVLPGMIPPLNSFQAALLYHAMLRDQLRACAELSDAKVRICFAPGLLPGSFEGDLQWEIQRGSTPEERLSRAFESAFRSDGEVLALGYEPQFLPAAVLMQAFEALKTNTVVIGKGLVGFRRFLPSMLRGEPHRFRGMAVAYSLKYAMLDGALSFENHADLIRDLSENSEIAPLCSMTLASIA